MKREFTCKQCGEKFEIEAEVFEPGISGDIYTSDGQLIRYVDPTDEHSCPRCISRWYSEFLEQLSEFERREIE